MHCNGVGYQSAVSDFQHLGRLRRLTIGNVPGDVIRHIHIRARAWEPEKVVVEPNRDFTILKDAKSRANGQDNLEP